jgi:FADH2 O2-dependent halogenase
MKRVTRVVFALRIAGQEIDVPARMVVDATGRHTLLGKQLRVKQNDPIFDQFAVHAWFKNVDKGTNRSSGFIHIYFLPVKRGWAWQIPITDEITSMGIVAEKEVFKNGRLAPADYFQKYVDSNPDLTHAMRNAERSNEFKLEGDYSYKMDTFAGNGFRSDWGRRPLRRSHFLLRCKCRSLQREVFVRAD